MDAFLTYPSLGRPWITVGTAPVTAPLFDAQAGMANALIATVDKLDLLGRNRDTIKRQTRDQ
jgi:hypothetical protein